MSHTEATGSSHRTSTGDGRFGFQATRTSLESEQLIITPDGMSFPEVPELTTRLVCTSSSVKSSATSACGGGVDDVVEAGSDETCIN